MSKGGTQTEEHEPEAKEHREAVFGDEDRVSAAVYERDDLRPGARIDGPAIIEQLDSTVVVPPGDQAEVDGYSNIIIHVGGEE